MSASQNFDHAANQSFDQMHSATQGIMKVCEDFGTLARDHMDATMKSASAMSKGFEEIARNTSDFIQESFVRSLSAGKTIMAAKSVPEAFNTHNEFVKDCFDCWVSGAGKISEISARTAQNAMGPIAEQTNNAMTKLAQKANDAA